MRINQAWYNSAPAEINDLGIGTGLLEHGCIITHCNKAIATDGNGLSSSKVLVDRDDLTVVKDEIGGLCPGRSSEQGAGKQKAGGQEVARTSVDHGEGFQSHEMKSCAGSEGDASWRPTRLP